MAPAVVSPEASGQPPETFAELSSIGTGPCDDMVVGPNGDAWVGNFRFDYWAPAADAVLFAVDVEVARAGLP